MRATPSPTEMTDPTSLTSTLRSKFSIWSRMMLVISSALICAMCSSSQQFGAAVFTPADTCHSRLLIAASFHACLLSDPVQDPAHRSIVNRTADLRLQATQQIRIPPVFKRHILAGQAGETLAERRPLLF